jgi:N-glycosylase/DNA lyase
MRMEIEIGPEEISGPLNLSQTITSGQTAEPEWEQTAQGFLDVDEVGVHQVKLLIRQQGPSDSPRLVINIISPSKIPSLELLVKKHIIHSLRLKDDLNQFYSYFREDPIERIFAPLRGLRLMQGTNLFESLICSLLSQNNSVLLWNRSAKLLEKYYGRVAYFPDGTAYHLFPDPRSLASAIESELHERCLVGYRARYIVEASKLVCTNRLDLEALRNETYERSRKKLIEVIGIGPKVADCFILYGLGKTEAAPVDIWIHKIVKDLFFDESEISKDEVGEFLRCRYGHWAGYAQLYLYYYARKKWNKGKRS